MAIVNAEVRFAPQLTAWFTANPTKVLQDGEIVYCSDGANIGKYVIGDNSAQLSTLTFYGGISSSGLTIGTTTITSGTNTRILYNNAGVVGEYLVTGTGTTAVLSTSPTFTTDITTPLIIGGSAVGSAIQYKGTTGVGTSTVAAHQFLVGNNGGTTAMSVYNSGNISIGMASTQSHRLEMTGAIRQTIGTGNIQLSALTTNANVGVIYLNQTTPSGTNYSLASTNGSTTYLNGVSATQISVGTVLVNYYTAIQSKYQGGAFSGNLGGEGVYMITPGAAINLTANTEVNNFQIPSYTWTWNTGAFSNTQIFNTINSPTIAFNGASTATLVANFAAKYPQGGTNATITTSAAIYVPTLALTNTTTGIGIYSVAPSGATTNYAAYLSGLTLIDNANLRVGSGSWNNYQFEVVKTQNSALQSEIRNSSNGTAAYTEFTVRGDSTQQMRHGTASTGYTTSGLFIATTSYCISAGVSARTLYGHISTANDIIFVNGGLATTDEALRITSTKSVSIGNAALATTATDGFLYVTACAGVPTGVPTAITGRIPIVADSTNNKLYIYSGGAWVALN